MFRLSSCYLCTVTTQTDIPADSLESLEEYGSSFLPETHVMRKSHEEYGNFFLLEVQD